MPAEGERNQRHDGERGDGYAAVCAVADDGGGFGFAVYHAVEGFGDFSRVAVLQEDDEQDERGGERGEVQRVFVRQLQRFTADFAVQLAEGDERAGEGHGADEDADEDFNEVDGVHFGGDVAGGGVAADADQDGGEADEAVQERDQLRHLCHFDFARFVDADGGTNHHRQQDVTESCAVAVEGGDECDCHADDAV